MEWSHKESRSAASIPANIAEGYGREYRAEYIQFLRTAQGSLKELETHLILSVRVKLTTCPRNRPDSLEVRNFGEDATLPHPFPPEQSLKVLRILHSPLPTQGMSGMSQKTTTHLNRSNTRLVSQKSLDSPNQMAQRETLHLC